MSSNSSFKQSALFKKSLPNSVGSFAFEVNNSSHVPLAERMRPKNLDEIIGQDNVVGPNSAFGKILRSPSSIVPSVVLTGPPGVGKTTIARVIANQTDSRFLRLSGVLDGVKELRQVVTDAEKALAESLQRTVVLVDEIHRFNKSQQDAFLPHLESGLLTIIGQTTENVSFRLRNALLSRLRVLELQAIDKSDIELLVDRALVDQNYGLGEWNLSITDDARSFIASIAGGDARRALTSLEWVASVARSDGIESIDLELVEKNIGSQPLRFDQDGDYHYDTISAFIKSMRGSDPDAALYYLVSALEAGEDPQFLTRRMMIFASEDCGCDPRALEIAVNCDLAVERIGLPEGRICMAQAVVYLACASKSNASYKALRAVEQVVRENRELEIPRKLKNAPTDLMLKQGNSLGYNYPHNEEGGFVAEDYLPDKLVGDVYYKPTDRALEAQIGPRLERYRELVRKRRGC